LKLPRDIKKEKYGRRIQSSKSSSTVSEATPERVPSRALAIVARNDPGSEVFIERFTQKHCKSDVSEEWLPVDDRKLDTLRGILAALKEENQATQLLKRESDDRQASLDLQATMKSVKEREEACKALELVFEDKKAELKEDIVRNEKQLQMMEANIEKGERKSKEEQAECKRLDHEMNAVECAIKEHEEGRAAEEKQIERAAEHKAFLESVVQECEEDFEGDIKVLMNRFHTLRDEKESLHSRNSALASQLNQVREEMLKVQAELQTEQMMGSSRLHESQVALERLRSENKELEQKLNRMLEDRELRKSQVGVIQMAIEQLFTRIRETCRLPQRKVDLLAKVEDIKYAPVRSGLDARLHAKLTQIILRVKDLRDMSEKVRAIVEKEHVPQVHSGLLDEDVNILDKVQFVSYLHNVAGEVVHSTTNSNGFSGNVAASASGSSKGAKAPRRSASRQGAQTPPLDEGEPAAGRDSR